jgi:hypothetical protein
MPEAYYALADSVRAQNDFFFTVAVLAEKFIRLKDARAEIIEELRKELERVEELFGEESEEGIAFLHAPSALGRMAHVRIFMRQGHTEFLARALQLIGDARVLVDGTEHSLRLSGLTLSSMTTRLCMRRGRSM